MDDQFVVLPYPSVDCKGKSLLSSYMHACFTNSDIFGPGSIATKRVLFTEKTSGSAVTVASVSFFYFFGAQLVELL
jgi:hypothetical protein